MRKVILAAVAALAVLPATADAYTVHSTGYCLQGTMANGQYVHWGAVANNFLPLGARIKTSQSVYGRRYFRVKDRIGWGSQLDIWFPTCSQAYRWGRRTLTFRWVH